MQGVALVLGHYTADELDTERLVRQLRDIPPRQLRATTVTDALYRLVAIAAGR